MKSYSFLSTFFSFFMSTDTNTGSCNTGHRNTGDYNTGGRNTGDYNTGSCNTGSCNTGSCNTGHRNTGMFNTDEPKARLFGKECSLTMTELLNSPAFPDFSGLDLTVWVSDSMMNDKEKSDHPTYKTTGGYLKTIGYKEMWSVFWRKTSEENRKKFLALPNFCPKIFKEITGIDTNDSEAKCKATELRKKADELLKQATELESSL